MVGVAIALLAVRDVRCIAQDEIHRQRTFAEQGRHRLSVHQFPDKEVEAHVVQRADVRVIQRGYGTRLALEATAKLCLRGLVWAELVTGGERHAETISLTHCCAPS